MTVGMILKVLALGDIRGSALKELAAYYGCENYDLSPISDDMANLWIERRDENDS